MIESEIIEKVFFGKNYTKHWSQQFSAIESVLKVNPYRYRTKGLNREKVIGRFYEK